MLNQYNGEQLETLLKEIIDERRPPDEQENQAQEQDQDRPNAKNRTPWFGLDDTQLKEYTNRVSEQLGVIQGIDLTIAKAVAAESEEADGLNIAQRQQHIRSVIEQLDDFGAPLSEAQQGYRTEQLRQLGYLESLQERYNESEQHRTNENTELNQPNIKFSGLSIGATDKVRVYMAVVSPTDEGSRFKDFKLQDGQVVALSDQLWIGVGTPYKALAWLQKYQLENNRGNAHAVKSDSTPVIRSIEVDQAFIGTWLQNAVPEGGISHYPDGGLQQPWLMYVDVKTPNQFGLKTSAATLQENNEGQMVLQNVEDQQSTLLQSLLTHADPASLQTISFKHNLHLRDTAVDGEQVDLNVFMERLGYRTNPDGPAVRLLGQDATVFHTMKNGSWGFSTHSEQMAKVERMNTFFDELQQTVGRPEVLSSTRRTSDSSSSLGYDSDGSSLEGDSSSRDSDSDNESVRSHSSRTEEVRKQLEARIVLKHQLVELLEVNHLTPGALVKPAPSLTSTEQRDKHGNNQVRALVESGIAHQVMGDASLDRKEITESLKNCILQDRKADEVMKRVTEWVTEQGELEKLEEHLKLGEQGQEQGQGQGQGQEKEQEQKQARFGWLKEDGSLRYVPLEPAQMAKALTNYYCEERGVVVAEKTVSDWLESLKDLDGIEGALERARERGDAATVERLGPRVEEKRQAAQKHQANIDNLGPILEKDFHTSLTTEKLLQNKMIQTDLVALRGVGSEINAKALFEELDKFANAHDDKSMRAGGNLFCHCMRIVAQDINNRTNAQDSKAQDSKAQDINSPTKAALKLKPHPEMTPEGEPPQLIVNNRVEKIDYSALLNQTPQANGLPFDKMRSSAAFVPAFTESNKIASNYMIERDLPFTGGISGTTRDIIKALPVLEGAGGKPLSDNAKKSLVLINAAFMVENQYHSMFEALYPAARCDVGGIGDDLLEAFDASHTKHSNTAVYQRALQTMTGSNDIWRGAVEQLSAQLGQAIEPGVVTRDGKTIQKVGTGKDFKPDEILHDKGIVICALDPKQTGEGRRTAYALIRDFGSSPIKSEKALYPYRQDQPGERLRTREEKQQLAARKPNTNTSHKKL